MQGIAQAIVPRQAGERGNAGNCLGGHYGPRRGGGRFGEVRKTHSERESFGAPAGKNQRTVRKTFSASLARACVCVSHGVPSFTIKQLQLRIIIAIVCVCVCVHLCVAFMGEFAGAHTLVQLNCREF